MGENENNEIKILIDALKYTSNIIIDLTNKLEIQENKMNILENKLNKFQKLSMENNLKLKTINIDKINNLCEIHNNNNNCHSNDANNSEEMSEYVIDKTIHTSNTKSNTKSNKDNYQQDSNAKSKIDKLIGSIVKRKDVLEKMMVENNMECKKNVIDSNQEEKTKCMELDYTIKTGTNKSNIDKTNGTQSGINDINEQEKITNAQNNDLNKANNILKQIRRRSNFARKM